jgi:hypothetical protein
MNALDREVPQCIGDPLAKRLAQAFQDGAKPATIGTKKVRVGNDTDDTFIGVATSHGRVWFGAHLLLCLPRESIHLQGSRRQQRQT